MATIHTGTTMAPTKLELLTDWLPRQDWYLGEGPPELSRAGGFRLDDPAGEVGLEFLLVTDSAGGSETTYFVPLSYRGAALDGADDGLVGTSQHGVLGTRWVYDAAHDPVAVAQLLAFVCGRVEAQHQNQSDTPDPSVGRSWVSGDSWLTASSPLRVANRRPGHTAVDVRLTDNSPREDGELTLELVRVLPGDGYTGLGHVEADWTRLGGDPARGVVARVW
jgi:maltokinase-like protein